jgi:hypothetical protein
MLKYYETYFLKFLTETDHEIIWMYRSITDKLLLLKV